MNSDLEYNGKQITWYRGTGANKLVFKATSGMPEYQTPVDQCRKNKGPIPEGMYHLWLDLAKKPAKDDGTGICRLIPSKKIQTIPRGHVAGDCEEYWANWGWNRVRLAPLDEKTRKSCTPRRAGFYLHDSIKGFSHGCVEVDTEFFTYLRNFVEKSSRKKLILKVDYPAGAVSTYGGTKAH